MIRQDAQDEAKHLFRLAATSCLISYLGYGGAAAELKALGATP